MGRTAVSQARGGTGAPETAEARALEALRLAWGNAWDISCAGARWSAARRDGTGHMLTRASADGLALALRFSHERQRR